MVFQPTPLLYHSGTRPREDETTIDLSPSPDLNTHFRYCDKCGGILETEGVLAGPLCYDDLLEGRWA